MLSGIGRRREAGYDYENTTTSGDTARDNKRTGLGRINHVSFFQIPAFARWTLSSVSVYNRDGYLGVVVVLSVFPRHGPLFVIADIATSG
jgi:hypothetical protein